MNDLWKLSISPADSEPQAELCPPLHHRINDTCIPDIQCSSNENDNSTNCSLECDSLSTNSTNSPTRDSSNCFLECDASLDELAV